MKMVRGVMIFWPALFLALTSVSAVQKLTSINGLKKLDFDQSVPKHSLVLLHWFANIVDIDNNDIIWLTFDPNRGDYGSHHYGNYERVLDPLPQGNIRYRYYTVGNINPETSSDLPSYVVHTRPEYAGRNRDRIIFRVREQSTGWQNLRRIDQVYITQHYETSEQQGTRYDPEHTYQISTNLLRQIREFSVDESEMNSLSNLRHRFGSNASDSQLRHIRNVWGDLACLGLLLFIVIQEKYSPSNYQNNRPQPAARRNPQPAARRNPQPDFVINIPESRHNSAAGIFASLLHNQSHDIRLKVTTGTRGKATILWKNIPRECLNEGAMVALYKNDDDNEALTQKYIGDKASGSYDTSVPLSEGFQVRLHRATKLCFFWSSKGEELHRGPEFESPKAVNVTDYNAKLQLFVNNGKACARLFVRKSFSEWRYEFKNSWVGIYSSADKATNDYEWWQWQWATKFQPKANFGDFNYDIYEYHSGMAIAPGVQARFILQGEVVKACTPSWRG